MNAHPRHDTHQFGFIDLLDIGQHLSHVPELRAAWYHMLLECTRQKVIKIDTSLARNSNDGAWGHDLTGAEAEALLSRAAEGTNTWISIWLVLMTYSQPRTVSYLLRKKRAEVTYMHMGLIAQFTAAALKNNLMLPPWKSFAWLERSAANVSELDQWFYWLEATGKVRAMAGPIPLPDGRRRRAAKRCACKGNRREVIKLAKERLGADVGAWSTFLGWVGHGELEVVTAIETAAATLESDPEPFPEPKKRG